MSSRVSRTLAHRLVLSFLTVVGCGMLVAGFAVAALVQKSYLDSSTRSLERQAYLVKSMAEPLLRSSDSQSLQALAASVRQTAGCRVTVIDRSGRVMADSDGDPAAMENHAGRPEFAMALSGNAGTSVRPSPTLGISMLYVAVPLHADGKIEGAVRLAVPLQDITSEVNRRKDALVWALLVASAVALGAAWLESRRISRPIYAMLDMARALASGDFTECSFPSSTKEIDSLGSALNTTARRLSEMMVTLRDTNRKLSAVLESSNSGILLFDCSGNLETANRVAFSLLGCDGINGIEVLRGASFKSVLKNPELIDMVGDAGAHGKRISREVTIPSSTAGSHGQIICQATAIPLNIQEGPNRTPVVLVLHDVTAFRELDRVRTEFVQNISHELRTPVTIIKGFAETLKDLPPQSPSELREMASLIYEESTRLQYMVESLLDLAKVETGYLVPRKKPVDVREILARETARMLPLAQSRGRCLSLHVAVPEKGSEEDPANSAYVVDADAEMLSTVVRNLIDNAIKHTREGTHIEVRCETVRDGVIISVHDDGPGIDPQDLPRVFSRFFRVQGDSAPSGAGLGLAIVKHIVDLHSGKVWVTSKKGQGASFFVWLANQTSR